MVFFHFWGGGQGCRKVKWTSSQILLVCKNAYIFQNILHATQHCEKTDREADVATGRQRDRQIESWTAIQTHKQTDKQTDRESLFNLCIPQPQIVCKNMIFLQAMLNRLEVIRSPGEDERGRVGFFGVGWEGYSRGECEKELSCLTFTESKYWHWAIFSMLYHSMHSIM